MTRERPASETDRPEALRGGLVTGILSAGVVAGFLESLPHRLAGAVGIPIHLTPHYVWTIPVLDALLFLAVIGTVTLLGRRLPRLARREVRVGLALGMAALFVLLTIEPLHDLAALFLAAGVGVQGARMAGRGSAGPSPPRQWWSWGPERSRGAPRPSGTGGPGGAAPGTNRTWSS